MKQNFFYTLIIGLILLSSIKSIDLEIEQDLKAPSSGSSGEIKGVRVQNSMDFIDKKDETKDIFAKKVVIAVGRKGANWLVDMCDKHNIETQPGTVDIGVRYELPDKVMKQINEYMYEGKFIGRVGKYKDKVRTFCQNPSGFVSSEVYDNNLTLVNRSFI